MSPNHSCHKPGNKGRKPGHKSTAKVAKATGAGGPCVHVPDPGGGGDFRLHLPYQAGPSPGGEPYTVLLVADDCHVRKVTRWVLQRRGFAVLEADGPAEAGRACQRFGQPVHVLVSDLAAPVATSIALAEELEALRPGLAVVLVADEARSAVCRMAAEGRFAVLPKPFTAAEVEQAIKEALRQAGDKLPQPTPLASRPVADGPQAAGLSNGGAGTRSLQPVGRTRLDVRASRPGLPLAGRLA